jgi:hypothetical protein
MARRAFTVAFAALLIAVPLCASAQELEIDRITWIELRHRIGEGATTAIVPSGGTEQNGRHMALGKQNFVVAETARRIARPGRGRGAGPSHAPLPPDLRIKC